MSRGGSAGSSGSVGTGVGGSDISDPSEGTGDGCAGWGVGLGLLGTGASPVLGHSHESELANQIAELLSQSELTFD